MDAIGDYLYILVFLVIIVVNILKNVRKQKNAPIPDFSGNQPILEEDSFSNKAKEVSYAENTQFVSNERENSILSSSRKPEKKMNIPEKEEDDSISISFENTDDARRAFIYSEIWNRKY